MEVYNSKLKIFTGILYCNLSNMTLNNNYIFNNSAY